MLSVFICIVFNDFSNSSIKIETTDENVDSIIDLAIEQAEIRIDDYLDVNYFVNLNNITSITEDNIQTLSVNVSNEEIVDEIDEIQYETLTSSICNIFDDLSNDEYEAFATLAEEDADIAEMLDLIESDFSNSNDNSQTKTSNVIKLSAGLASITALLTLQKVCSVAIKLINGAYTTMITALKAYFVSAQIKAAVITAGILVLSTIIIVNWNKLKPVFNKLVNIFIDNAKNMVSTVKKVFESIQTLAIGSTTYNSFDDVVNKNTKINERMKKSGKTLNDLKQVLIEFLEVSTLSKFYNSKNKILCIGRDMEDTYNNYNDLKGYQNYAEKNNYWSFWVENYSDYVKTYTQEFLNLCNDVLIRYCCSADWDFILVTNPYHYMAEHLDINSYGGSAYASEISIIRTYNYNYFVNSTLTWNTIPYPGKSKSSYFSYAGYRISK